MKHTDSAWMLSFAVMVAVSAFVAAQPGDPAPAVSRDSPIGAGETIAGELTETDQALLPGGHAGHPELPRDGYHFEGFLGDEVTITARCSGFEGALSLVGPTGEILEDVVGSSATGELTIRTTLLRTGRHRIVLVGDPNREGEYTLTLR